MHILSVARKGLRLGVYNTCKGCCCYCGNRLALQDATLDHLIPASRGGRLTEQNLVLSCGPCNRAKGDRSLEQFLAENPQRARVFVQFALTATMHTRKLAVLIATHTEASAA